MNIVRHALVDNMEKGQSYLVERFGGRTPPI